MDLLGSSTYTGQLATSGMLPADMERRLCFQPPPGKFSSLSKRTSELAPSVFCKKTHVARFLECAIDVYSMPPSCGTVYIGQAGHCANNQTREHVCSLQPSSSGLLLKVWESACSQQPSVVLKSKAHAPRGLIEVYCIFVFLFHVTYVHSLNCSFQEGNLLLV